MNTSFGYNRNDRNWVDAKEIVFRLVDIVSKGGKEGERALLDACRWYDAFDTSYKI